jgi:methylmalonyl-CoA/ethylmalonyl-CoA epimerase
MITKFNHVAIVVPNLDEAAKKYKNILGAKVSKSFDYLEHGVSVVFVELDNTKIELMHPHGDKSPIKKFLEKNNIWCYAPYLYRSKRYIYRHAKK